MYHLLLLVVSTLILTGRTNMKLLQTKEKFRLKLFIIYDQLKRKKSACFFEGFYLTTQPRGQCKPAQ